MDYQRAVRLLEVYTLQEILEYNDIEEAEALVILFDDCILAIPPEPCN